MGEPGFAQNDDDSSRVRILFNIEGFSSVAHRSLTSVNSTDAVPSKILSLQLIDQEIESLKSKKSFESEKNLLKKGKLYTDTLFDTLIHVTAFLTPANFIS